MFSRAQAEQALALGWTQDEVLDVHVFGTMHGMVVEDVALWGVRTRTGLGQWCVLYRDLDPAEVARRLQYPCHDVATCYTDGSGTTAKKAAGVGVYIVDPSRPPLLLAHNIGLGTNNVAELTAVWVALRQFPQADRRLLILSDSEYTIGSLTLDWASTANAGLIRAIRQDLSWRPNVTFAHVDGHSGVEGNEIADSLAKIGRKLVQTKTSYWY